jgi:hypothetical protein
MSEICRREAVPVVIGSLTLYCESFRAAGSTVLYEQPTVTGATVVTNKYVRATKLVLTGRIYAGDGALPVLTALNNMNGTPDTDIVYRGVTFPDCTVQGFTAEDRGDDMLYVTVTLAAAAPAEDVPAETEAEP